MASTTADSAALRDLIWAVCSPSLLSPLPGWPGNFTPDITPAWFFDIDTEALERHVEQNETRFLGSYFEALWAFFFAQHPRYELIARNLQIRDEHRTIGEFDFIVSDRERGQVLQLELAVKFYLGVPAINTLDYTDGRNFWIGPQARDRLDIKIKRALEHQLRLHQQPEAKEALRALGVDEVEPRLLFKGYLFHPKEPVPVPDYVAADHGHGDWLHVDDIEERLDHALPCIPLPKQRWLAPACGDSSPEPLSVRELAQQLGSIERPAMVVQWGEPGESNRIRRYFITPAGWPGLSLEEPLSEPRTRTSAK